MRYEAARFRVRGLAPALLVCAMLAGGCEAPPAAEPGALPPDLLAVPDTGVAMRVHLPRDTISVGDGGPLELRFTILNGNQVTEFDNNPGAYTVRVLAEDGTPVPPVVLSHGATGLLPQTRMVLPGRSTLGQVVDLRCFEDGGGYWRDPSLPKRCLGHWELGEPGTYRVVLEYDGSRFEWRKRGDPLAADSSTNVTRHEIVGGRRMADTATLVVRPR